MDKINQPDKTNHKCLDSENGPDKKNHKCLDSENGVKVKDFLSDQVKSLLHENKTNLEEQNRALWSLIVTDMDGDEP